MSRNIFTYFWARGKKTVELTTCLSTDWHPQREVLMDTTPIEFLIIQGAAIVCHDSIAAPLEENFV